MHSPLKKEFNEENIYSLFLNVTVYQNHALSIYMMNPGRPACKNMTKSYYNPCLHQLELGWKREKEPCLVITKTFKCACPGFII